MFTREYPKHADRFIELFDSLERTSIPNVIKEVVKLKKQSTALKLSNALLNGSDGEIDDLIGEYQLYAAGDLGAEADDGDTDTLYQVDLEELFDESLDNNKRIRLYPKDLNEAIGGGVLPGHHIVIFAMPETGKTLFTINLVCGMLRAGHRVLYIGNEEPTKHLMLRFLTRMTGWEGSYIRRNLAEAQERAEAKGYDNLILKGLAGGTFQEIDGLIAKYKPKVVVVDQILKMKLPTASGPMETLTQASDYMRKIGKKHGVVPISLTQAGDSATGHLILQQGDVFMSNTAVPGDADLMIGIGINKSFEQENKRMLNLPKNKVNGNHTHFAVKIDPRLNKVTNL